MKRENGKGQEKKGRKEVEIERKKHRRQNKRKERDEEEEEEGNDKALIGERGRKEGEKRKGGRGTWINETEEGL